jgi:hypothetical protein
MVGTRLVDWLLLLAAAMTACGGVVKKDPDPKDEPPPVTCSYQGVTHASGDSFPAEDGCNSCSCNDDGSVGCTEIGCVSQCDKLSQDYLAEVASARTCTSDGDCSLQWIEALTCGCTTFVNPQFMPRLYSSQQIAQRYADSNCNANINCGPCPPLGVPHCSAQGSCEAVPAP